MVVFTVITSAIVVVVVVVVIVVIIVDVAAELGCSTLFTKARGYKES